MKRSQATGGAGSTGMAYYVIPAVGLLAVCVGGRFSGVLLFEHGDRGHYNPELRMTLEGLLKESDPAMYTERERKRRK